MICEKWESVESIMKAKNSPKEVEVRLIRFLTRLIDTVNNNEILKQK